MCYFRRLRKPRRAEEEATPLLRNKAERPGAEQLYHLLGMVRRGWFIMSRNGLVGYRLGLSPGK